MQDTFRDQRPVTLHQGFQVDALQQLHHVIEDAVVVDSEVVATGDGADETPFDFPVEPQRVCVGDRVIARSPVRVHHGPFRTPPLDVSEMHLPPELLGTFAKVHNPSPIALVHGIGCLRTDDEKTRTGPGIHSALEVAEG